MTPVELDHRIVECLINMKYRGIGVDSKLVRSTADRLLDISLKQRSAWDEKYPGLNPNSPPAIGAYLEERHGLPDEAPRTSTGKLATDEAALDWWEKKYDFDMVGDLKAMRSTAKLYSNYVQPLLCTNRVHCDYYILGTDTGRLSARNPNLTNQPKGTTRVTEDYSVNIRDLFVAKEDHVFVSADWSQLEICIMAHVARDEVLIDLIRQGKSMHDVTAEKLGIPRQTAKIINLAKNYGGGPRTVAAAMGYVLGTTERAPREIVDYCHKYDEFYAGVTEYREQAFRLVLQRGYISTVFGRKRYFRLPETREQEWAVRNAASNAPIQGTASDIAKMAMLQVEKELPNTLILQVHDELILEVRRGVIHDTAKKLASIMTNIYTFAVPLKVSVSVGERWGSMEDLPLD